MIDGMDYLFGAKYPELILKNHPKGWAAGFFFDLVGDTLGLAQKMVDLGLANVFRFHLGWSDTHTFTRSQFDSIAGKAKRIESFKKKNPHCTIYVSFACEHRLGVADTKLFADKTAKNCPSCVVVNASEGARVTLPNYVSEIHGANSHAVHGPYIASFDGTACLDSDVETWKKTHVGALIRFWWEPSFNLRCETNDLTPRDKRKYKPTAKHWAAIITVSGVRGDRPVFAGTSPFKMPENLSKEDQKKWVKRIWKSNSEAHLKSNPRDDKPLAIIPAKAPKAEMLAMNGKVIATALNAGTYDGIKGTYRYYFQDMWGIDYAKLALRTGNSAFVVIRAGNKLFGPVRPDWRDGEFQK